MTTKRLAAAFGVVLAALAASPASAAAKAVWITDAGFSPAGITIPQGRSVRWTVDPSDLEAHSATTFFFDSGPKEPGSSYAHRFISAGNYRVTDSETGNVSHVHVPIQVEQVAGQAAWTVTAASRDSTVLRRMFQVADVTSGNEPRWVTFTRNTASASVSYNGSCSQTYEFRALTGTGDHFPRTDLHSGWSRPIAVSAPICP